MSDSIGDAFVEIGAKTGQFYSAMDGVEKKFLGTSGKLQEMASSMAQKLGVTIGGSAMLATMISASAKAETETLDLAIAIKSSGGAVDELLPKVQAYATELAGLTTYSSSSIKNQMAMALQMGVSKDKINEVTKAAIGLSAKYKLDLATSMDQVSRLAIGGSARWLSWKGVIDKTASSSEQFKEALRKGNDAFAIAEAHAGTMTGQYKQLKDAIGNTSESFGKMIGDATGLKDVLVGATEFVKLFSQASDELAGSPSWAIISSTVRGSFAMMMGDTWRAKHEFMIAWDAMKNGVDKNMKGIGRIQSDENRKMVDDEKEKYSKFSSLTDAWKVNQALSMIAIAGKSKASKTKEIVQSIEKNENPAGANAFGLKDAVMNPREFFGQQMVNIAKRTPVVGDLMQSGAMGGIADMAGQSAMNSVGSLNPFVESLKQIVEGFKGYLNTKQQEQVPVVY